MENNLLKRIDRKRRALGQHFLLSIEAVEKVIASCDFRKTDVVFEIGTGRGILTEKIAPLVARIDTSEVDRVLFDAAKKKFSGVSNVRVMEGDAFALEHINFDVCVASLPYSRSLDFVEWLALRSGSFRRCAVLLQTDFVEKLLARPKSSQYRSVSVIAQIAFRLKKLEKVEPSNFDPIPRVTSSIVSIEQREDFSQPFWTKEKIVLLRKLFSFRGRTLRNAVENLRKENAGLLSPVASRRIEELEPEDYALIISKLS